MQLMQRSLKVKNEKLEKLSRKKPVGRSYAN